MAVNIQSHLIKDRIRNDRGYAPSLRVSASVREGRLIWPTWFGSTSVSKGERETERAQSEMAKHGRIRKQRTLEIYRHLFR